MCRFRLVVLPVLMATVLALPIRGFADVADAPDPVTERVVNVFTGGLGQIWERRALELKTDGGEETLTLAGISERAIVESLRIAGDGGPLTVTAVTLNREVLTPDALLRRHLGREVDVIKTHPTTGAERRVRAEVVSLAGGPVLRIDGRLETGVPGRLSFPDATFGLPPRPVLSARLSAGPGTKGLQLTYLSEGLAWSVDYTAQLATDGRHLDLTAWAGVRNDTGVDLSAQALRLVAGQINRRTGPRAQPRAEGMALMATKAVADAGGHALPAREAVGGAHVYTVPGLVRLRNNETRQLALLHAANVAVTETLISAGHPVVFGAQRGQPRPSHPDLRLAFDNRDLVPGGLPLPAGIIRVYRPTKGGPPLFAGEDRIIDTPGGERARLTIGRAFDVTVRRQQTAFQRLDAKGRNVEAAFRIEVRNGRDRPARVRLDETLPGDWRVTEENRPHERAGGQARWHLDVPAGGRAELTYRVRVLR